MQRYAGPSDARARARRRRSGRDGGALGMASLFGAFPFLLKLYADGGCQGTKFQAAVKKVLASVNVEIVKRSDQAKGFLVLPNRWISAGSLSAPSAWLGRRRRLAKDWERLNRKALAFLRLASIHLMLRKLAIPREVRGQTLRDLLEVTISVKLGRTPAAADFCRNLVRGRRGLREARAVTTSSGHALETQWEDGELRAFWVANPPLS